MVAPLLAIASAGLGIRVAYTLALGRDDNPESPFGDAFFFHEAAKLLADGHGFSHPFYWVTAGIEAPTAAHPPLWPALLSLFSLPGIEGETAHRMVGNLVGAALVAAIGLLAHRLAGPRAGLVAAAIAAVYPVFVGADGSLMSEPLAGLLIVLALLAAYRYVDRPEPRSAVLLGLAIGAAALTRGEGAGLLLVLALPVVAFAGPAGTRLRAGAAVLAAFVLLVAPWTIRNAVTLDGFVPISTNVASVVGGANCAPAYSGEFIGSWIPACAFAAATPPRDGRAYRELELSREWLRAGRDYALDHPERWPAVAATRVLRTWGVWQPRAQASAYEGQHRGFARLAVLAFFPLALVAALGLQRLRPPRTDLVILLSVPLLVTLTSVLGYGTYRFRHPAEAVLIVLAAIAVVGTTSRTADHAGDERVLGPGR